MTTLTVIDLPAPEPEKVTITLTREQLDALVSVADYGIDEREYDLDENHPYDDDEEAEVRAELQLAIDAIRTISTTIKED